MRAKVLTSFVGTVVGTRGQEIDIIDKSVYEDLLQARYIEPVEEAKEVKETKNEGKRTKSKKSS